MALPRGQEDGRLEGRPPCREDVRHLARRVHRLLRTHRGPPRPHHFPESALRQGELLEQDEVPALLASRLDGMPLLVFRRVSGLSSGTKVFGGVPLRLTRLSNVVAYECRSP